MKILGYFATSSDAEAYAKASGIENYTVQHTGHKTAEAPFALILSLQPRSKKHEQTV